MTKPTYSVVVPTLGWSRWLVPCLEALRHDDGDDVEILLVSQGENRLPAAEALVDQVLRPGANLGFAGAVNLGSAAARGEYLATVNDDAIVEVGWSRRLLAALAADPTSAAVQGIHLMLDDPEIVDGGGLAWNRWWQAVQIGHGRPLSELAGSAAAPAEIFGVSATAAIYRRTALAAVADGGGAPFDAGLFAYYEDVELACRLRAAGYRALRVPAARVRHAGSQSGQRLRRGRHRLIHGNRHLVLARLLGRALWPRLPRVLGRDLVDLLQAARRGEASRAAGIVAGGFRALARGPRYARLGGPLIPPAELLRFRADPARRQSADPGPAIEERRAPG